MPAKSESQRRLFGLAHACKTGQAEHKYCLGKAGKIAKTVSDKKIKEFTHSVKGKRKRKKHGY